MDMFFALPVGMKYCNMYDLNHRTGRIFDGHVMDVPEGGGVWAMDQP